ncbi:transposase [Candidatus Roizmanbacteria bacterium]|nr:transposase [Candidatus Roizmanbacteria bacterium]
MLETRRFVKGKIYHIFNKSISNFRIFKTPESSLRFIAALDFYNKKNKTASFSKHLRKNPELEGINVLTPKKHGMIKFLSYCIMPDHYHILIKALTDDRVSKYISDVENSFSRYFNVRFNRKGPLWQSRVKSVLIRKNEQLLHVSRYIHLNPTTSKLVINPEDWEFSSYRSYIYNESFLRKYLTEISIENPKLYKKFVEDQKDYQQKLKTMRSHLVD